jgi:NADH:ubiquinone reductase (H+-translocating)
MRIPGVAQPAIQMGKHAAKMIAEDALGNPRKPSVISKKGDVATIGRHLAVADVRRPFQPRLSGYPAWLAWLLIHLLFLAGFLTYPSRSRAAGLIAKKPKVSNVDRR